MPDAGNRTMGVASLREHLTAARREAEYLAEAEESYASRLRNSVIRPLSELTSAVDGGESAAFSFDSSATAADRLWALTKVVTGLASSADTPTQVVEAAAALQDLTLRVARAQATDKEAADALVAARIAELANGSPGIQVAANGPYLVSGAAHLTNHLGEAMRTTPHMALCRCGGSLSKPWCDGTHARIGFSGEKDPKRVPDRRDTYVGASVTVFDNRGVCQHSGFCTDRLKTVFHADGDRFVTPSGGRMDEIVDAVRDCPSGALSFAVDGREMRDVVDRDRPPSIEISKDGPYRVTGGVPLTEADGQPVVRSAGASLEHYALCRCGQSRNKPFCSGMHWYVNFADPPASTEPTIFEWAGGYPAFLRTTKLFYQKYVPADPLLAPLFADMSPDHPERVASWLSEVFGGVDGEPFYSSKYGDYTRMLSQHIGKYLTEEQRARWATLMYAAANEATMANDADFRAAFISYIEWGTRLAVENSQTDAHPPQNMPMPHWWWVCNATPWSRLSALAPAEDDAEEELVLPTADEPLSFDKHIKKLFRTRDRMSMKFAFDLWSYDDVCAHADEILSRVRNGSMPCDGAWPTEKVDAFARWIAQDKPV